MKKTLAIAIILLLLLSIFQTVQATGSNVQINFTGGNEITQDTKTITLTLSLGDFTSIPESPIMGYEAILSYDKTIFSSVTAEGLNNWQVQYDDNTGRIIGETTTTGEPNKEITKLTFTLQENATTGATPITLKEGLLTVNDEDSLDTEFEKTVNVTIVANKEEQEEESNGGSVLENNENSSEVKSSETSGNSTKGNNTATPGNTTVKGNTDKTTVAKALPSTGIGKIAMIVLLILMIGTGCFIRYKSIETK